VVREILGKKDLGYVKQVENGRYYMTRNFASLNGTASVTRWCGRIILKGFK
jgi:hypothetical protein